jgi:hypothetical protein
MQAQGNLPGMKKLTMTIIRTICAGILTLTLSTVATNAQTLLNGGFSIAGGIYTDNAVAPPIITTAAADWTQFNNGLRYIISEDATNCSNVPEFTAHGSSYSLWCYGDTAWTGEGAYQTVTNVYPGQTWVASAVGMTPCSDALTNIAGGNPQMPFGELQIAFLNANGATITPGVSYNIYGTNQAVLDTWQSMTVTGTAPPGTTQLAVYVMELGYGAGSQGLVFFDGVSLTNLNTAITTNNLYETIGRGNQVCWVSDTNSTWQPQGSVNNTSWVNLGQAVQGDGNTDCVFDSSLTNKFYRVLQLQ